MNVKMRTLAAGPNGVYNAGQVVSVTPAEGQALIKGGYAEGVKDESGRETASVRAPEQATASAAKPEKRGGK